MDLDEVKAETTRLSNWAHLATVGADGKPDVVPVWPAWHDGKVWIFAHTNSVKVRNLEANADVAMHWQVDESGDGVEVWGTATVHTDLDTKRPLWDRRVHLQPRRLRARGHGLTGQLLLGRSARAHPGAQAVRHGRPRHVATGRT